MKIYIVTHKEFDTSLLKYDYYIPLYVGKGDNPEGYVRDNTNDNIADKNDSYCELSALYWIWKNSDCDIVGLEHYHRFFVQFRRKKITIKGRFLVIFKRRCFEILSQQNINQLLSEYDIIVKNSVVYKSRNADVFLESLNKDLLDYVDLLIANEYTKYHDEYRKMMQRHTHFNCNMFIGYKSVIDQYCGWLYEVLNKIDDNNRIINGDRLHNRELGYVGEMLFEPWIRVNNINYKCVDTVNTTSNMNYEEIITIKDCISKITSKVKL